MEETHAKITSCIVGGFFFYGRNFALKYALEYSLNRRQKSTNFLLRTHTDSQTTIASKFFPPKSYNNSLLLGESFVDFQRSPIARFTAFRLWPIQNLHNHEVGIEISLEISDTRKTRQLRNHPLSLLDNHFSLPSHYQQVLWLQCSTCELTGWIADVVRRF